MTLLSPHEYVARRQAYNYKDRDNQFTITPTDNLLYGDCFKGIFPAGVPESHPRGINMRKLEAICQSVFEDCSVASSVGRWSRAHLHNLKSVVGAVVHWKMATQGGRPQRMVRNVLEKWTADTHQQLLVAYRESDLGRFRIGGVRIPTATAFLRFLRPDKFGVMDRRVASCHTQPMGITTLKLRAKDNYISDVRANLEKYYTEYIPFLTEEATALNSAGVTFDDVDESGNHTVSAFRPCDVEMARFASSGG